MSSRYSTSWILPKWPRVGAANISDRVPAADARHIHGEDGLGDAGLVGAELHNQRPAEKVISEAVRESPGEVTIVALGPLTNLAVALQREKELATQIDQIIMIGGSIDGHRKHHAGCRIQHVLRPRSSSRRFCITHDEDFDPIGSDATRGDFTGLRQRTP